METKDKGQRTKDTAAERRSEVRADQPVIEGRQYHIDCAPGDVARYVLTPGDPARVNFIAGFWDEAREVAHHREYHTMTGSVAGVPISSVSTGIGGPSLAIAVEELARIGADTFIRVGTTGGLQPGMELGDIVITSGGVRFEGTSKEYIMTEYPAVASYDVVLALVEACEQLGVRYHVGITASTDTFYPGQERPGFDDYLAPHKQGVTAAMQQARVLNFEMEASALLTLAQLYGLRSGAVCVIIANRVANTFRSDVEDQKCAAMVAVRAVQILAGWDSLRQAAGKRYFYPGLLG